MHLPNTPTASKPGLFPSSIWPFPCLNTSSVRAKQLAGVSKQPVVSSADDLTPEPLSEEGQEGRKRRRQVQSPLGIPPSHLSLRQVPLMILQVSFTDWLPQSLQLLFSRRNRKSYVQCQDSPDP